MAPKKKPSVLSSTPIAIGNCEVVVEAPNFSSESSQNSLQITLSRTAKIKISVVESAASTKTDNRITSDLGNDIGVAGHYYFSLVNPKDPDGETKSSLKEVLCLYSKELPAMNYAANTGKKSMFLERCISNGKYCTLILHHKVDEVQEEVVSAITYQIIPADTQYAEVPVAAVSSKYQKKGFGRILYRELSTRLRGVGVRSIFCWGDKESEGFWLKQGFSVIGEVDQKGRARKLHIKADIRKALCFPGGSTLLVSHLGHGPAQSAEKLNLSLPVNPRGQFDSDIVLVEQQGYVLDSLEPCKGSDHQINNGTGSEDVNCKKPANYKCIAADSRILEGSDNNDDDSCSCSMQGAKKRGFSVIGEVDQKGRARKLHIKADIRKALCFPGGSTLLVSHLGHGPAQSAEKLNLSLPVNPRGQFDSDIVLVEQQGYVLDSLEPCKGSDHQINNGTGSEDVNCKKPANYKCIAADSRILEGSDNNDDDSCSCSMQGAKKRVWESSCTSLKSKKIKGGHSTACQGNFGDFDLGTDTGNIVLGDQNVLTNSFLDKKDEQSRAADEIQENKGRERVPSTRVSIRVMLMNIADDKKISSLTKIIEDLGGSVTSEGTEITHIVTGKARKTLNFCIGLCSGAWIVSSGWLKESYRKGRFVDEVPFILKDEDYESKYRTELKVAVLKARNDPHSLLKGYDLCVGAHVQPPIATLTAIIKSAGGNIIQRLEQVKNPSRTIFIASEEDMEDTLLAVKKEVQTFGTDWLMNCIMRHELDLGAPTFAESL